MSAAAPQLSSADLEAIAKLPAELRGIGYIQLLRAREKGSPINSLRSYCAKIYRQENQEKGGAAASFVSIDDEREGFSLAERIAASDPAELLDDLREHRSRWELLDPQSEKVMDLMATCASALGAAVTGFGSGLGVRRIQMLKKAQVERAEQENDFKQGRCGQGGLFDFGGEAA